MQVQARAGEARIGQLFPECELGPAPGTFELGLVLGGTVSAGTYTAKQVVVDPERARAPSRGSALVPAIFTNFRGRQRHGRSSSAGMRTGMAAA